MSILARLTTLEAQVAQLQAQIGDKTAAVKHTATKIVKNAPPPAKKEGHKDMVLCVLNDGIPRTISKLVKDVSEVSGKKQKRDSINVMCSKLFHAGDIARPSKGVYQKIC